ncbi:hypothetical protein [Aequorivita lipolytica]|uniref:Uncharacterized protein n=1 Tax=Aequorivita lipolytica TaxID=153267 RepID=A0A5C6YMD2_9FLAO|nr:hypothetical protein [Aequorivita lipolytica]TXD68727.1 hypothetical protein ESV24_11230 [Aequorivita lipolytica]SRX53129.1 hypothetical protein AEQU2_02357 [Aequorivita lipolytica]
MKRNIFITALLLLVAFGMSGQTTDLARVEYLVLPFSKSDNSINRYRALVQAPISVSKEKKSFFVIGLEYRYVDININDNEDLLAFMGSVPPNEAIQNNLVTSVQQMDGYLGYTWKHNEDWRFGAKAGVKIQSDFQGSLMSDDFIFEAAVYAILDKKNDTASGNKPYRFIAGLTYSTTPGRWYPLPLLNYYKEFHKNWTYTLGVPKTNVRHYLNDGHKDALQAFATLDNVYANIQQNFVPIVDQGEDGTVAESIQMTLGLLGLGYEHFFTDHLLFYGYAAHSVYNDFRLEDGDGKKVYKINTENSPYFRAGLKFKY